MRVVKTLIVFVLYAYTLTAFAQAQTNAVNPFKWDLTDIYCGDDCWEKEFLEVAQQENTYIKFINTSAKNAAWLSSYLVFNDSVKLKLDRLYTYAMFRRDINVNDPAVNGMIARVAELDAKIKAEAVAIEDILLHIDPDLILSWINEHESLKGYEFYLQNKVRLSSHALLNVKEEVIALTKPLTQLPFNSFVSLSNPDFSGLYKPYIDSIAYNDHLNTFASLLNGNLLINKFYAKIRNYESTLEAALYQEQVDTAVYVNLIETVKDNISPLQNWFNYKREKLGISKMTYNTFSKNMQTSEQDSITFDQALALQKEILSIIHPSVNAILDTAVQQKWYDVYPTKNKRRADYTGFYISGHPYLFLNWKGDFESLITFFHESGHTLNVYFSGKKQPIQYFNVSTFYAEVAAEVNELLLLDYMVEHAKTKDEKLFYIEQSLMMLTNTFFMQALYADFEKQINDLSEGGNALTAEVLTEMSVKLYKKYFGPGLEENSFIKNSWAMIPHYYYNYYLYSYATGTAVAYYFVDMLKSQGAKGQENYLKFLQAGSSDYPVKVLLDCQVDIASEEFYTPILAKMQRLVNLYKQVDQAP